MTSLTLTEPHTDTSSRGMAKTIAEQLRESGHIVNRGVAMGEAWLLWVVAPDGSRFHVTVQGRRS